MVDNSLHSTPKGIAPCTAEALTVQPIPHLENIRRILVCQLRQIGDVMLATPALELLAQRFPQAEIHFFTEKKCVPMVQGNPHIHTIWPIDKKALPTLLHEVLFYRSVAKIGFDIVVDFQQLPRCRWVVAFSRAPIRLSYTPPWYLRPLYTHWATPHASYAAAYKAQILAPLGIVWNGERPRLYLTPEEHREAADLLDSFAMPKQSVLITLDVTHRHATRRWPAQHYAKLIDLAVEANPALHFILPFGPGEEEEVHALRRLCKHAGHVHIPSTMLSLRAMAACIERAALHCGNCSSPRHMAVAVGTPTLTILGSTSPAWTFPSPAHTHIAAGLSCQPCNKNTCPTAVTCLSSLSPETVLPIFLSRLA